MRLSDVLKRLAGEPEPAPRLPRFASGPAQFNLPCTHRLVELFAVPREQRDADWLDDFWAAAWTAALAVPKPAVIRGPDGFPYLRLNLPADTSDFEANSLMNVAAGMVEQGVGAALFASAHAEPGDAQYVVPMGVLDSILRFDDPAGEPSELEEWREATPRDGPSTEIKAGEQMLIATPSDQYLSKPGARALHRHLVEEWGLADPHIAMIHVPSLRPARSLVIGRKRSELLAAGAQDGQIQGWMERLRWHLPPSRSLMLMPEDWSLAQMTALRELF